MSYRLQFIVSKRFMEVHYQNWLILLLKEFIKLNVNTDTIIKYLKRVELYSKIATDLKIIKKELSKDYQKNFDEKLKKRFFNTYKLSNHNINKFILLLRKSVYSYEHMDDWKKLSGTLLPERQEFYRYLNIENITDGDRRIRKIFIDFEIKI